MGLILFRLQDSRFPEAFLDAVGIDQMNSAHPESGNLTENTPQHNGSRQGQDQIDNRLRPHRVVQFKIQDDRERVFFPHLCHSAGSHIAVDQADTNTIPDLGPQNFDYVFGSMVTKG